MTEITKIQKCLITRNGIEIWLDQEKWEKLEEILNSNPNQRFINIESRLVNIADIVGIFKPEDLINRDRKKSGEWRCKQGKWHTRNEKCDCATIKEKEAIRRRDEAIKNCGKCKNGFIISTKYPFSAKICECVENI